MKRIILDTNVLLRFLIKDLDDQVVQVRKLFKKAKLKKLILVVHPLVILEIVYALDKFYGFPKNKAVKAIAVIINSDFLVIEEQNILRAAIEIYKSSSLDFTDCFLTAKAREENSEVFSFDKDLKKRMTY